MDMFCNQDVFSYIGFVRFKTLSKARRISRGQGRILGRKGCGLFGGKSGRLRGIGGGLFGGRVGRMGSGLKSG